MNRRLIIPELEGVGVNNVWLRSLTSGRGLRFFYVRDWNTHAVDPGTMTNQLDNPEEGVGGKKVLDRGVQSGRGHLHEKMRECGEIR